MTLLQQTRRLRGAPKQGHSMGKEYELSEITNATGKYGLQMAIEAAKLSGASVDEIVDAVQANKLFADQ